MSKWTDQLPEAARDYIGNRRVDEVECIIGDIAGVARGKAMPAAKFAKQTNYFLPNSIFLQTITGEWADNPFDAFTEPDMILEPDWSTATAAPWTADVTLQVVHDAKDQQGNLIAFSPRNVLKRIVALYEAQGWKPVVAPEMEFFLTARNIDPNQPVIPPMGRSGRRAAGKQAYSLSAVDEYGKVIDDIYDFAEAQGLEIDGILQEGGAGQIELNLAHGDPVRLADDVFFFKRLIREAALRHDCFATFMAKPIAGEPGSAMHIHTSVVDTKTGKNIFAGPKGVETEAFHALHRRPAETPRRRRRAVCALREQLPPLCPGLRRADQPGMGPRQPHHRPAHPDLLLGRAPGGKPPAGDGLQPLPRHRLDARLRLPGLMNKVPPRPEFSGSAYIDSDEIPANLGDALDLLDEDHELQEVMGPDFVKVYDSVKRNEYKEFLQVISPWEREHLLLNV